MMKLAPPVAMCLLLVHTLFRGSLLNSTFYDESEFIALELAGHQAEWLRNLLADMPLCGRQASPVSLHCDSHAVIGIDKNSVYNNNKKDIFTSDMVHLNSC